VVDASARKRNREVKAFIVLRFDCADGRAVC
jgi:hypothetical protein